MENHLIRFKSFLLFFSVLTIALLPMDVFGNMNKGYHVYPEELKTLPRWCQCRMLIKNHVVGRHPGEKVPDTMIQEDKKWAKAIGEDIIVFTHHYCAGLNWINRYKLSLVSLYEGVESDRERALESALGEFKFMRGRLTPKHALYYSMLMNEAYIFREQKNIAQAVKNYQEIMKLKPGYAPAYVEYAGLLISLGKTMDAKKILQVGLEKTNSEKSIERMLSNIK